MSTLFSRKKHERLEAKWLADFEAVLAKNEKLKDSYDLRLMNEMANATINGKTAINRRTGKRYTAAEVKEARAADRALKIAQGQEKQLPEVQWMKGYGVVENKVKDDVEAEVTAPTGPVSSHGSTPSTEGMATASAHEAPSLPLDAALKNAVSGLTPGTAVGPTRKAARVQGKRKKLDKISTPEPGSVAWFQMREREEEAAREVMVGKRRAEAGLRNPISGGKTPSVPGGSYGFPSLPDTAPPKRVDKNQGYLDEIKTQGAQLGYQRSQDELERLSKKYGVSIAPAGKTVVRKPKPKKYKKPPKKYKGGGL